MTPCKCGCGEEVTQAPGKHRPRLFASKKCADKWHNARRGPRDHHKASMLDVTALVGMNAAQAAARRAVGLDT